MRVVQRRVRIRQSYLDAFLAAGVTATADIRASVKVPDPDAGELREKARELAPPGSGSARGRR